MAQVDRPRPQVAARDHAVQVHDVLGRQELRVGSGGHRLLVLEAAGRFLERGDHREDRLAVLDRLNPPRRE
jgi:hypothetical protein